MTTTNAGYRPGLDQLRGLASYLVFCWHFVHTDDFLDKGTGPAAVWPLSMINMGYVGVALFMVLSGYLFAGITLGRDVNWRTFLQNRALRLLPLLAVAVLLDYLKMLYLGKTEGFLDSVLWGWLMPTLPRGGWSITVECHFYALLPLLLWVQRQSRWGWLTVILAAVALRTAMFLSGMDIALMSSVTILGRIDQFLLGMMMWQARAHLMGARWTPLLTFLAFSGFMSYIDHAGAPTEPEFTQQWLWTVMSTIEGLGFAVLVAWWDVNRGADAPTSRVGRFWVWTGKVSYSMYLLHGFWAFIVARWCQSTFNGLATPESAILLSTLTFIASVPVVTLSYRFIELPFLRSRRRYAQRQDPAEAGRPSQPADLPLKDAA